MDAGFTEEVVDTALLCVFESAIGVIDVGELFGGLLVAFVLIGVILARQALERTVNLALSAVVLETQNLIEVASALTRDNGERKRKEKKHVVWSGSIEKVVSYCHLQRIFEELCGRFLKGVDKLPVVTRVIVLRIENVEWRKKCPVKFGTLKERKAL